jgi:hypothetical protein
MALLDKGRAPSASELRYFGFILAAFGAVLAAIVFYASGSVTAAHVIWIVGAVLGLVYYAVPPLKHPLYEVWMRLLYPIGWLISHVLVGAVYYLVLTPIGLVMRLFGRDVLARRRAERASSYWRPLGEPDSPQRYFQQF